MDKDLPFNVLWQHGLIGYRDSDSNAIKYLSESDLDNFLFPKDKKQYMLHTCIVDYLGTAKFSCEPTN